MKALRFLVAVVFCTMSVISIKAQTTMDDMQYLTINENVTTVITASEPVRFVDISTDNLWTSVQTRWQVTSPSTTQSVSNPRRVWTYTMMAMC